MISLLDIIIGSFLLIGMIVGFVQGFIMQIGSLIGLLIAVLTTKLFSETVAYYLNRMFEIPSSILPVLAFILSFFIVLLGCHFLVLLIHKVIHLSPLGVVNRVFGSLVGGFKFILLVGIFLFVIGKADSKNRLLSKERQQSSVLYEPLCILTKTTFSCINLDQWIDDIGKQINKKFVPLLEDIKK